MNRAHFLNIDLDLESTVDISLLIEELSAKLHRLTYHVCEGKYRATFESNKSGVSEIISEYLSVIESLSFSAHELWSKCEKREFNLGFQSGFSPKTIEAAISPLDLSGIVSVNGELGITIYAAESENS